MKEGGRSHYLALGVCRKSQKSRKLGVQKPFDAIEKLVRRQMWAKSFSQKVAELFFPTDSFSQVNCSTLESGNHLHGNNVLDSSPCGLRVDWSYVRVFSWFALQMNHENQTTKSHEPGITKRHKGSADESSMLLPFQRLSNEKLLKQLARFGARSTTR